MISGRAVLFRLSPEGQNILKGLVPENGSFQAFVVNMDTTGPWILLDSDQEDEENGSLPVMMLKWEYVATATFEYRPEGPGEREPLGF